MFIHPTRSAKRILFCALFTLAVFLFSLAQWRGVKLAAAAPMIAFAPCTSPQFAPAASVAAGAGTLVVAIGDFNSDNKQDLVIRNPQLPGVTVWFGNGSGNFPTSASFSAGNAPYAIAVGDFNLDGKPDIATANFPTATVSILLGNGNGTFQSSVDYYIGNATGQGHGVSVGDFNRDGKPDLAINGPSGVTIMLGNGDGTFQINNTYDAANNSARSVLGDFNRDGNLDIAVANQGGPNHNSVSILLGNGNGTFQAAVYYGLGTAQGTVGITGGDFNGDGILDLATSNYISSNLSVLLGNGNGTFQAAVNYSVPFTSYYPTVGDFNADGALDLVAPSNNPDGVGVLLGNGNGTFQAPVKFNLPAGTDFVTAGDINGDHKPDLLANVVSVPGSVSILLNTCACAPPDVTPTAPAQVCASSTGNTISIPSAGAGASYTWTNYGFNGAITGGAGTNSITFTAGATGMMTLGVTVTNAGGCVASKLIYIPINPLPTLGNYPATGPVNVGASANVTPDAPPSQSPTISSITASAPGFTGNLSVNKTTGVVTISNAGPAGTHTVTVTATDNCGATATRTFSLTVNGPPTIAGKTVALQAGATAANRVIATVNDDLTPRANLVVTVVPPLPVGITVTAISAPNGTNGNVTATVAADCLAGTGNNNVTLRVTDGNGLTAQATLKVNVIPFYSYQGGIADNFALTPPDAVFRRPALSNLLPALGWGNFDVNAPSRSVGHSFVSLPANILRAELDVHMKPRGAVSADDTLRLGLIPPNTFAFTSTIANLPGAGSMWVNNSPVIFTLDLGNLPGGGNLLPKLNTDRYLDVVIGADTTVDYMRLRVWICPPGILLGGAPAVRVGQSSFTTNLDGSVQLTGLDAPGLHGYQINLGLAEGAAVSLTPGSDLRVAGDSIGVQFKGVPPEGGDEQVLATATLAGNGTNVLHTVDFNLGSTQSLYELRNATGALVRAFVAPNNSPLTFVMGGSPYTQNAKTFFESRSNTTKIPSFNPPVTVLDPGGSTTPGVTDISVTALQATINIGFVTSATVQGHLTGGAMQSGTPGVVLFRNVLETAHPLLPGETQTATLTPVGDGLTVGNIGSSGMDGAICARIVGGDYGREMVTISIASLDSLETAGAIPIGAFLRTGAIGSVNAIPNKRWAC